MDGSEKPLTVDMRAFADNGHCPGSDTERTRLKESVSRLCSEWGVY